MVDLQTKITSFAPADLARLQGESVAVERLQGGAGMIGTGMTGNGMNGSAYVGITGANAHAAVRMHAHPVSAFWAFCPKTKTPHFQRWKVALR